jgi:sec-independent protein translocase protein TatC
MSESLTFWDHIEQLRRTLLWTGAVILLGTIISLAFHKHLFALLEHPIVNLLVNEKPSSALVVFSPTEGMTILLKVCFWTGLVATSPFWLYIILKFILPGLTVRERRLAAPFFLLSSLLFSLGVLFAYLVTLPIANRFLYDLNASMATNLWGLGSYISYSLVLLLAHGLLFEGFVILLFLIHLEMIRPEQLVRQRRAAVVLLFIVAALLTPPDVITQCLLALPALGLYELMILYGKYRQKSRLMFHVEQTRPSD